MARVLLCRNVVPQPHNVIHVMNMLISYEYVYKCMQAGTEQRKTC